MGCACAKKPPNDDNTEVGGNNNNRSGPADLHGGNRMSVDEGHVQLALKAVEPQPEVAAATELKRQEKRGVATLGAGTDVRLGVGRDGAFVGIVKRVSAGGQESVNPLSLFQPTDVSTNVISKESAKAVARSGARQLSSISALSENHSTVESALDSPKARRNNLDALSEDHIKEAETQLETSAEEDENYIVRESTLKPKIPSGNGLKDNLNHSDKAGTSVNVTAFAETKELEPQDTLAIAVQQNV